MKCMKPLYKCNLSDILSPLIHDVKRGKNLDEHYLYISHKIAETDQDIERLKQEGSKAHSLSAFRLRLQHILSLIESKRALIPDKCYDM